MRIVERARLGFREGNSDKVYEVDLVEVVPGQYVVNFRYGRRGSSLRDGTKTPLPLALDKARSVFTALVAEKTRGGYQPLAAEAAQPPSRPAARGSGRIDVAAREARTARELIGALQLGHRGPTPLHLVVRKVGERGLPEAEPVLLELLASGSPPSGVKPEVLRHFVIAALARCGSARSLPPLRAVSDDTKAPRHLRSVAELALTMLGGAEERRRVRASIPAALRPEASHQLAPAIRELERLLVEKPLQAHAALFSLYVSAPSVSTDDDAEPERLARRAVLSVVRIARLRGQELGVLRALNWAAELRRDGELFACLVRRFESDDGDRATLGYFRRRAGRVLRRLGSIASPDYVEMATELLLAYREHDAEDVRHSDFGTWDAFGRYHSLNFVLYAGSPRYERAAHRGATWRCREGYTPGDAPPKKREEAFPRLWDMAPPLLWRLGISDAARVVIQFATRALREQTVYLAQVTDEALAAALGKAQPAMRLLAFEIARERMPNPVLARGALASGLEDADAWVIGWLERTPGLLGREIELLALLITAPGLQARAAIPRVTRDVALDEPAQQALVSRAVAILMQLGEEPAGNDRARAAGAFLLERAPEGLERLGIEVVRDLLAHPLPGVAELGGEVVLRRSRRGALAAGLLDALLESKHASVRSLGARIVADTPASVIKNEPGLLVHLALSANAELREGTRGLLGEVARLYPAVGGEVASRLIDALLVAQPAGAPAHVVLLLRHELRNSLPKREQAQVMALIGALSPHAREAGGLLVAKLEPEDVDLETVVRLANHEILLVRQGAWALAEAARQRFRIAPIALARLCDARWEDTRAFAFGFVRTFSADDLVPDVVIAICDSIQPLVQEFGQQLLLEHWRDEHGERYLLRLSEHPSANIQLLVSGLLNRIARGNVRLLEQLLPCLSTVLSQVNRGGVAKQRVLEFLRQEAATSAEAAALLAPLLERQSLTTAVSHKQPLIATMVELHERYPDIAVPISVVPVPLRARGSHGI